MGLFFGFLVRDTLTKLWKLVDLEEEVVGFLISPWAPPPPHPPFDIPLAHHLFLSFSFGGWKLLFDIRNKALREAEEGVRGGTRR